jgi:hypothetical protein
MADNVLRFEFLATDHFTPTANRVSEKLAGMGRGSGHSERLRPLRLVQ